MFKLYEGTVMPRPVDYLGSFLYQKKMYKKSPSGAGEENFLLQRLRFSSIDPQIVFLHYTGFSNGFKITGPSRHCYFTSYLGKTRLETELLSNLMLRQQ